MVAEKFSLHKAGFKEERSGSKSMVLIAGKRKWRLLESGKMMGTKARNYGGRVRLIPYKCNLSPKISLVTNYPKQA